MLTVLGGLCRGSAAIAAALLDGELPTVAESALLGDHTMALQTVQLVEMLLIIGFDGLVRSDMRVPALWHRFVFRVLHKSS